MEIKSEVRKREEGFNKDRKRRKLQRVFTTNKKNETQKFAMNPPKFLLIFV